MKKLLLTASLIAAAMLAQADKATTKYEGDASQFGKNYVTTSAQILSASMGGTGRSVSTELGVGAFIELSFNLYKDEADTYGVNLALPLAYSWMAGHTSGVRVDIHQFQFPAYLRPYYRFKVSEDLTITPFLNAGVGGLYTYTDLHMYGDDNRLDFVWGVGGGVEFMFFKNFAFTPKYEYTRAESSPTTDQNIVGAEFAWKFTKNMALFAEYQHIFMGNSSNYMDNGRLGVRFEF